MTPWYTVHADNHKRPRPYTAYYECQRGHKNPMQQSCPVKRVNAHRLEAAMLEDLERLTADPQALTDVLAMLEEYDGDETSRQRLSEVRAAQRETEARIAKIVDAVETGEALPSLTKRLTELERNGQEYRAEAMLLEAELRQARREVPSLETTREWFLELRRTLEEATGDEKKELMSLLVQKIEPLSKKEVQVAYYLPPARTPGGGLGLKRGQAWLACGDRSRIMRQNATVHRGKRGSGLTGASTAAPEGYPADRT